MSSSLMPSLFISHGSPMLYLDERSPARAFMTTLGTDLPKPKGIVVISAHWYGKEVKVTANTSGQIIHDFYNFPQALYEVAYEAKGSSSLVDAVVDACGASVDEKRGLDHGAWVPVGLMYPDADIPTVQVSIPYTYSYEDLYDLGRQLAPLREQGIMIMGSGSATHNLRQLGPLEGSIVPWAQESNDWFVEIVEKNDHDALMKAASQMPHFVTAHPEDDHWRPIYVALGAAQDSAAILHNGIEHCTLSMTSARFD